MFSNDISYRNTIVPSYQVLVNQIPSQKVPAYII